MSSTDYALLGLLSIEPMSGYDIRKHLKESLVYFWSESYGQIYPSLKRIAREGLIVPVKVQNAGKRERQVYAISSEGRERLREWLARPPKAQPARNEFLLKLFLGHSAPPGACLNHIYQLRKEQEELLAMFLIIRDSVLAEHAKSPHLKYWTAMMEHGIRIRRAEIDWCNQALRVLSSTSKVKTRYAMHKT